MLAVGDVWDNQVFFDALSEGTLHSAIAVTQKLMSTSKSACRSNMLYALALHLQKQITTRNCTPALTSKICGILFVLQRFQKQCAFVYAAVFERLMAQMPYMYTPDTHACMRGPLHAYARQQYKEARAFHTVLRELEASCQSETTQQVRTTCFHLICKSVVVLDGKHHLLLDFPEQSPAQQARFCEAMCANLNSIARGSNLEIGVFCALEAVASVAFSSVIFYTLFHEFSLAVCVRDSFRVQMLHGSLARSLSSSNDAISVQQYVLDNDLMGHALLLYHAHSAVRDEGLHIAMCSLLWQLVTTQRRMLPAHFEQMLQVRAPLSHPRTHLARINITRLHVHHAVRATVQIFAGMDPALGWPATVMLMVLRLVTSNYKCYLTSTADVLALVLAIKNVCLQSNDACAGRRCRASAHRRRGGHAQRLHARGRQARAARIHARDAGLARTRAHSPRPARVWAPVCTHREARRPPENATSCAGRGRVSATRPQQQRSSAVAHELPPPRAVCALVPRVKRA